MPLLYDADVDYDSPLYTYDGDFAAEVISFPEALSRELKFGGALDGLVDASRIVLDERLDAVREYPWCIFRRITSFEDNQTRKATERWEIEVLGRVSGADDGDEALQAAQDAILDAFAGKHRFIGQYTSTGEFSPGTGIRARCSHVTTVELIDPPLDEKAHLMIFLFTYVRPLAD